MTPCQERGYESGDVFTVITHRSGVSEVEEGETLVLKLDDGSEYPCFVRVKDILKAEGFVRFPLYNPHLDQLQRVWPLEEPQGEKESEVFQIAIEALDNTHTFKHPMGIPATTKIHGFKGIITAQSRNLHGCDRYYIDPPVDKEGKIPSGHWFDEADVVPDPVAEEPIPRANSERGGPHSSVK